MPDRFLTIMEKEIVSVGTLDDRQKSVIDMHSFLNVMNVLIGELDVLSLTMGDDNQVLLAPSMRLADQIKEDFYDRSKLERNLETIQQAQVSIAQNIQEALATSGFTTSDAGVQASVENIQSVLEILYLRTQEMLERIQAPHGWRHINTNELLQSYIKVLAAIEKNSRGCYHFTFNPADQKPNDYLIDLSILSDQGDMIDIPSAVQDVFRDLLANARKYTAPGGVINAVLVDTGSEIKLVVQDNGRGIPENEIDQVVQFGHRATNVRDVRTLGGGFGLTKAFVVTKEFGGRMWIKSQVGVGTRITIVIPKAAMGME